MKLHKIVMLGLMTVLIGAATSCSGGKKQPAAKTPVESGSTSEASEGAGSGTSGTVRVLLAGWNIEDGLDPDTGNEYKGIKTWFDENFTPKFPDITVELNAVPWDAAQQKQQVELSAGNVDVCYVGGYVTQYYQSGLLRDIDDLVANDSSFDPLAIYPEGLWNSNYSLVSFDQTKHYGLPAVMGQYYTVYDKQLFEEWGVEPLSEYPKIDEIIEKAAKMTGKNPVTGQDNYGVFFNCTSPVNVKTLISWSYAFDITGGEGSPSDFKNIKWDLNDQKMKDLWGAFAKLLPSTPPGFVSGKGYEDFGMANNNVAIYLEYNGGKIMGNYFLDEKTDMIDRFVPVYNVGPKGESWVVCDPIVMAKNPKDQDAAWEVMKALASPERQEYHYVNFRWTPALKSPTFINELDKYTPFALKIAENAHYTLIDETIPFYTTDITPAFMKFLSDVVEEKNYDIPSVLDDLQRKAEAWSATQ